jgi:hypothetical protein
MYVVRGDMRCHLVRREVRNGPWQRR